MNNVHTGQYSKSYLSFIFFLSILMLLFSNHTYAALDDISSLQYEEDLDYETYINNYTGILRPEREIVIPAVDYSKTDMDIEITEIPDYSGKVIERSEERRVGKECKCRRW